MKNRQLLPWDDRTALRKAFAAKTSLMRAATAPLDSHFSSTCGNGVENRVTQKRNEKQHLSFYESTQDRQGTCQEKNLYVLDKQFIHMLKSKHSVKLFLH